MNDLAKKLNITDYEGWYTVTNRTIRQHGGHGILNQYSQSVSKALAAIYPEYLDQGNTIGDFVTTL
jgi:hypothetical protein